MFASASASSLRRRLLAGVAIPAALAIALAGGEARAGDLVLGDQNTNPAAEDIGGKKTRNPVVYNVNGNGAGYNLVSVTSIDPGVPIYLYNLGTVTGGIDVNGIPTNSSIFVGATYRVIGGQLSDSQSALTNPVSGTDFGIRAQTTSANVKIYTRTDVTARDGTGILASTTGAGQITINAEYAPSGTDPGKTVTGKTSGISATSGSGSITISGGAGINTGLTDGDRNGIVASSASGSISISGASGQDKTTATGTGKAIDAQITGANAQSDISITRSGDILAASGVGVYADNQGSGDISITNLGNVTSTAARGVSATGKGNITVATTTGGLDRTVSGGTDGIYARTTGDGKAVSVSIGRQDGNVKGGAGGRAIYAESTTGLVTVGGAGTVNDGVTGEDRNGIVAWSGTGSITVEGTGATKATGAGNAITAWLTNTNAVGGAVTVTRSGAISAERGVGIDASNYGLTDANDPTKGSVSITVGAGGVSSKRRAISALTWGGRITIDGDGSASAVADATYVNLDTYGNAIVASTTTGAISIGGAGATTATGKGVAIDAAITDKMATAQITINRSGAIAGVDGYGIRAVNRGSGGITITAPDVTMATTANTASAAIRAWSNTGDVVVTVASGTTVTGGRNGNSNYALDLGSYSGDVAVNNAGTIDGAIYARNLYRSTADGDLTSSSGQNYSQSPAGQKQPSFTLNNTGIFKLGTYFGSGASFRQSVSGSPVTINNQAGGMLTGTGSFGSVTAESGSRLRPGDGEAWGSGENPAGARMTVATLIMKPGSILEVRANLAGGQLQGDSLAVTDSATFQAGSILRIVATPGTATESAQALWKAGASYDVVVTDNGRLTGLPTATSDLAFLAPTVAYTSDDKAITLTLKLKTAEQVAPILAGPTQYVVARALLNAQAFAAPPSSDGQALIDKVNNLSVSNVNGALDQLYGRSNTGGPQVSFNNAGLIAGNVLTQTLVAGGVQRGGAPAFSGSATPLGYAADPEQTAALEAVTPKDAKGGALATPAASTWRLWATGLGSQSTTDARAGLPRVTGNDWGLAAGFDYVIDPTFTAGVALGGTSSRFSVSNGRTTGTTEGGHGSLYGIATSGPAYLAASLGYGRLETRAKRSFSAFGTLERYGSRYDTDVFTGQAEIGWRLAVPGLSGFTLTPFAGLTGALSRQHAYAETPETTGAVSALAYKTWITRSLPGQLGLQAEQLFALDAGWSMVAQARAAWVHEFSTKRRTTSRFVALPGSSFSVDGVGAAENVARLVGGLTVDNGKGLSLFGSLTADVSREARSYAAQAGVKVGW